MITSTLRTILERAASDAGFRESLLRDPDSALAAVSLSADEAAVIHSLSVHQLAQFAADMSAVEGELTEEMLETVAAGRYTPSAHCMSYADTCSG